MFKVIQKPARPSVYRDSTNRVQRKAECLLTCCMIAGMAFGVWMLRSRAEWIERIGNVYANYLYVKSAQSIPAVFGTALCIKVLPLLAVYIIGLCAVGTLFLYTIPFEFGAAVGFISGYLYAAYALKGIGYCALLLFPGFTLTGVVLIYSCAISTQMSADLLNSLSHKAESRTMLSIRIYSAKFLKPAVAAVLITILETGLYRVFSGYFQLSS